jgi:hypothetical protein
MRRELEIARPARGPQLHIPRPITLRPCSRTVDGHPRAELLTCPINPPGKHAGYEMLMRGFEGRRKGGTSLTQLVRLIRELNDWNKGWIVSTITEVAPRIAKAAFEGYF